MLQDKKNFWKLIIGLKFAFPFPNPRKSKKSLNNLKPQSIEEKEKSLMNGAEKAEKSAKGINISLVHCPAAVEVGVGERGSEGDC
jgi:hypothetical protein